MFIIAGAAKLADIKDFARSVRLFAPHPIRRRKQIVGPIAAGIALFELGIGALSFSFPASSWLNEVVFATTCVLVAVSAIGFIFHRGASCRCFGRLSQKSFDTAGIVKSLVIAACAGAVAATTSSEVAVSVTSQDHLLLIGSAALVTAGVATAVRELAVSSEAL
jgi:hypothetical protein